MIRKISVFLTGMIFLHNICAQDGGIHDPLLQGSNQPGWDFVMENEPSGAFYDISITGQPERPWMQSYTKNLVTKLCLVNAGEVVYNFEQALEIIRQFDNITMGIQKIIYLVVFPDGAYPEWGVLLDGYKREQDSDPWESLNWLIKEAREKYRTLVSLHINMLDAYPSAGELYNVYNQYDVLHKQKDGTLTTGTEWDGQVSTPISYYQEWKLGFAQKRIDDLIARVPEIQTFTKSIHIDAFQCWDQSALGPSPYLGITQEQENATMRKIYRYWRDQGIDLTCEGFLQKRNEDFAGLQAWCWLPYMRGFDRHISDLYPPHIYNGQWINLAHSLRLAGWNIPKGMSSLIQRLPDVLVWYIYADDMEKGKVPTYPFPRPAYTTTPTPVSIPLPDPFILPIPWRMDGAVMIKYSKATQEWTVPEEWTDVCNAQVCNITSEGEVPIGTVTVSNGTFVFSAGQGGKVYVVIPLK